MYDRVPQTQAKVSNIQMAPGNVLIRVENLIRDETLNNRQNLIKGMVICVPGKNAAEASSTVTVTPPKTMDMLLQKRDVVLFDGRNSYPIDTKEGLRLFVVKVSDVALKTGEPPNAIPSRRNYNDLMDALFG